MIFRNGPNIILLILSVLLLHGCTSPEREHRSRVKDPSDLREQTEGNTARSQNPEHWNIRIRMESAELDQTTIRRAGIDWNVTSGNVRVGGSTPLQANGLRIGVTSPNVNASAVFGRSSSTVRQSSSMLLTTLNNHPATLSLRTIEPNQLSGQIVIYGHGGTTVLNRYDTRITGVELRVKPEVIDNGPYLRLHLIPILARSGQHAVEIRELRTTVRVRSGQSVLLSSADQQRSTFGTTLFSSGQMQRSESFAWIVTPEIMN
jgi:hypothetical protein